nr:hypothetical protein [Tanacetum cinerariifolium]
MENQPLLLMPHLQLYHRATLLTPIQRRMKRTLKEDPAYYPADRGNNDDDESSNDDDDDDDVQKDEEDKEEEEHLAPADPSDVSTDDLMTTVNQGMSVEEVERVVAQRVANAIEAIAIYETKTNLARKSMSQTERQEEKVAENASNKRKLESNHNRSWSQKNKGHKVPRAHTAWPINKKAYAGSLPLCNQCKSHHSGPCTVKVRASKPKAMQDAIEIANKLRNKKISTLVECQTANKKRLITLLRTIRTNDSRPRGKTLAELTLQGMGRRNITADLSRCVLNATITMMVHMLLNATSATDLAI